MEIYGDGQSFTFSGEICNSSFKNQLASVNFNSGIVPTSMNNWFKGCRSLTTVTGTLPAAETASGMFKNCYSLETIGGGSFAVNTNQADDMFYDCFDFSGHIIFNTVTSSNPEYNFADMFKNTALADEAELTVCFGSDSVSNGAADLVIAQMESAEGNIKQHDFPEFTDDSNGTTHSRVCSQCGETETENHTFDNGVCTVCGAKENYTVTVTNGTITSGEKEIYNVGDIVNVRADEPEEGEVFAYWQDGNGNMLSTRTTYSFVVLNSVDLTAVYNDNYVAESILDFSAVQTSVNGKNAIRYIFTRSIDTTEEVEEVGLIYATNKLAGYTSGAKVNLAELEDFDIEAVLKENKSGTVKNYKAASTSINGTVRFTYTIGNNTDCYVYAYGYVKLSDGTTLYTDLIATTYDSIQQNNLIIA